MIERKWRSLKNECALLHAFQDPHQALGYRTLAAVYENDLKKVKHAA